MKNSPEYRLKAWSAVCETTKELNFHKEMIKQNKKIISSTNKSYTKKLKECKAIRRKYKKIIEEMTLVISKDGRRKCPECTEEKMLSDFVYSKHHGHHSVVCCSCKSAKVKERYNNDKEWKKNFIERQKEWRNNQPEEWKTKNAEAQAEYRQANRELIRAKGKVFRQTEKYKKQRRRYNKKKQNDPQWRMRKVVSKHVRAALQKHLLTKKDCTQTTMQRLGCDIKTFVIHLESQFNSGMSWEHYGHDGWHLDHVIALAAFDLTKREQRRKAFHYTNYQPLWATKEAWEKAGAVGSEPKEFNLTKCDWIEKDGKLIRGRQIRKDGELL